MAQVKKQHWSKLEAIKKKTKAVFAANIKKL